MSRSSELFKRDPDLDYRALDRYSYSKLATYDKNILEYFLLFVLKDEKALKRKKEKDSNNVSLKMGNLIDILLTEPEKYKDLYYESSGVVVPSGQMLDFCQKLFALYTPEKKFSELMLEAYTQMEKEHKNGKLGTGFTKFVENFKKEGQAYFDELIANKGKTVISADEYNKARKTVDSANRIFKDIGEVVNKFVILFDYKDKPFKVEIDRMCIDHESKIVYLYDYKKSSFINDFVFEQYLKLRYYIQGSLYKYAVLTWLHKNKMKGYRVENMAFRVLDDTGNFEPLIYQTTDKNYLQGFTGFYTSSGKHYKGIDQILDDIDESTRLNRWGIYPKNAKNNNTIIVPDFKDAIDYE